MHLQPSSPVHRLSEEQYWPQVRPATCWGFGARRLDVAVSSSGPSGLFCAEGSGAVNGTPSLSATGCLPAATSAVTYSSESEPGWYRTTTRFDVVSGFDRVSSQPRKR